MTDIAGPVRRELTGDNPAAERPRGLPLRHLNTAMLGGLLFATMD